MQRALLAGAMAADGPIPVNGRRDSRPPRNHVRRDWMKEHVGMRFRALGIGSHRLYERGPIQLRVIILLARPVFVAVPR